jgi:DNA (cytosine-5)-methyltransferase 1
MDPTDARNRLALEIPKWAKALGASIVVIENVPRFLDTPTLRTLAAALKRQGYDIQMCALDASAFGVPQLRERAFTIASRIGPVQIPRSSTASPRTFREVVLDHATRKNDPMHIWPEPSALALERFRVIPRNGDKRDVMRLRPDLCPDSWAKISGEATDVWGRVNPDAPSNTLRCTFQNPSKGRYIHPFKHRVLSLREGARLQGIPERWEMCGERYPIARQIGNGVPVPLARAIGRSLLRTLEGERAAPLKAA